MPDGVMMTEAYKQGQNYRVIYQIPTDRLPRVMVATFLEATDTSLVFSLRPLAGTQELRFEWIKEIWTTTAIVAEPQIYRTETRMY